MWSHFDNPKFHHLNRGNAHASEPRLHLIGESAELSKKDEKKKQPHMNANIFKQQEK